jgi:hypothetical protein
MTSGSSDTRVLAIAPYRRGIAFAVLEGPARVIDWGARGTQAPLREVVRQVGGLIEQYDPAALVLEGPLRQKSRRSARARELIKAAAALARRRKIEVRHRSRAQIRTEFSSMGAVTKQEIAIAVAVTLPPLAPLVPPRRKPWMSEHSRMSVFEAAALALASFRDLVEPPD